MGVLTYKGTQFYLDGEPFVVISGTMHYFRIPRAYWHDRLLKLKECGFNTVETYTCWNLHELREGENEIVVFESDATAGTTVEFFAEPDLG